MIGINDKESGPIRGVGMDKLKIVVDGESRDEVDHQATKELARQEASRRGFSGGGLTDTPIIGPVGPDGEMLDGIYALNPNITVIGFRAEFLFAQRA
jgi:hypothetical protein